ncbi:hypothetical protein [Dendrosporobacter sp. 1207_IL3150]|uniref:hypothetical protein n=1 Tax=Dendrosporobacter sp. 1207_IL3150 TaxID=3084054 RepID=UPI002FD929BB
MGNIYDKNTESKHGPWGSVEPKHHGPYGNKDNQQQASASFSGEKKVKPINKPERTI